MKCTNCGREIDNDSVFCEFCGAKINNVTNTVSPSTTQTNTTRPATQTRKPTTQATSHKSLAPLWITLGVIAVIAIISVIIIANTSNSNNYGYYDNYNNYDNLYTPETNLESEDYSTSGTTISNNNESSSNENDYTDEDVYEAHSAASAAAYGNQGYASSYEVVVGQAYIYDYYLDTETGDTYMGNLNLVYRRGTILTGDVVYLDNLGSYLSIKFSNGQSQQRGYISLSDLKEVY